MVSNESLHYDENTLTKIYRGLEAAGVTGQQAIDAVFQMQNEGVLFREQLRSAGDMPTRWRPIDNQGNVGTEPAPENPPEPDPVGSQDDGETGPPETVE